MMRYSILVSILQMLETLLEAENYLYSETSQTVREELIANGQSMLDQIKEVLVKYQDAVQDDGIFHDLNCICQQWENVGKDENLHTTLNNLYLHLPNAVNYQVRAVFYAELGQKWDSMASVYECMRNDPRFDTVVVLTPVFRQVQDKNGKIRQGIIYEDYLTEMGIPFLHYNKYDLEQDCPELAFLCQPYEGCTMPQFWPANIAKYTRIVYLPYYLPSVISSDAVHALCQLQVYSHAWKVIGMSEKHLSYYQKHTTNHGENMLLTGLPKTDPLVHLSERKVALPKGWEKLQNKKVVLWNSWYIYGGSSLCFFEDLFAWFERHEDCALIWRPHPMTNVVTKLYDPEQYPRYCECLAKAENAANILVDHQTSCEAAFYFSNALISDESSMLDEYLFMDRPALWIQNSYLVEVEEGLISREWTEKAYSCEDIYRYLDAIRENKDYHKNLRAEVVKRDLPLSDGHCGQRVCDELWTALHLESGVYLEKKV